MSQESEERLVRSMGAFQFDPLGHVLFSYPWGEPGTELEHQTGPRKWQREILTEIGAKLRAGQANAFADVIREAVSSGHGIGKSALIAWLIKWGLDTFEDTKIVVTANTEKQLVTKTWPELAKWHRLSITSHWFTFTATSLFSVDRAHEKTWRADAIAWSETNTEAFAGLHNAGKRIILLFDESSAIADRVWEVAEGALTDYGTQIIWAVFGNPTRATGRFRECFRKFRHRWIPRSIDSRTVEGTNQTLFDEWVKDYGEDSDFVKVRVRGMFPLQSMKQFISEKDIDAAWDRPMRPEQIEFAPKILTLDNAWEGDDPLVIGLRQGLRFQILTVAPKNDNDVAVANLLARLEDEHKADAVFIDAGYGTGVYSVGSTLGRAWQLVWFAEAPINNGYLNKRAEMWGEGKKWLKEGGSLEPRQQLRDDLGGIETVPRLDGKIQLESKKDMKKRGIPSPNYGDAWALSFAYPVMSKMLDGFPGTEQRMQSEWDPFQEQR